MAIGDPDMTMQPLGKTIKVPAASQLPETPPSDMTAQSLASVRYWLDAISRDARKAMASDLCGDWARSKLEPLAGFADHGIIEHNKINTALIHRALKGD